MKSFLSTVLTLYGLVFVLTHFTVWKKGTPIDHSSVRSSKDLILNSDRHNFKEIRLSGTVAQSGHILLDLLFVKSYELRTKEGVCLRVFTDKAVPHPGATVTAEGTFRQFYRGVFGHSFGLIERTRSYTAPKAQTYSTR